MNAEAARAKRWFEIPILIAALMVVPVIVIEVSATTTLWLTVALVANWLIWLVFAVEFAVMMRLVDSRGAYARSAWLDIVIVLVSFPLLPTVLGSARLLRLLRLARVVAVLRRGQKAASFLFEKKNLGYISLLILLLAVGAGGLFVLAESVGGGLIDGMWWAVTTITTVGYGDIYPTTGFGRAIAVVVMFLGIGFTALLTGAIAATFVEQEETDLAAEVRRVHERLDRIESALGELRDGQGS